MKEDCNTCLAAPEKFWVAIEWQIVGAWGLHFFWNIEIFILNTMAKFDIPGEAPVMPPAVVAASV